MSVTTNPWPEYGLTLVILRPVPISSYGLCKGKKRFTPSGPCSTTQVIPGLVIYGLGGGNGEKVDYDLGYT